MLRHAALVLAPGRLDVYCQRMTERRQPGVIRDAIIAHLRSTKGDVAVRDIYAAVNSAVGGDVPTSSVRSYLNGNTPGLFVRTGRATYRLAKK